MINDCFVQPADAKGEGGRAQIRIREWGDGGDIDHHCPWIDGGSAIELKTSVNKAYGLYWELKGKSRYVFAPPQTSGPRRWGLGENDAW